MKIISNKGITDPTINLALEEYCVRNLNMNDDYLLFYINEPSIIIGKHQNTIEEINSQYVNENGIHVVRRISGGGAVYRQHARRQRMRIQVLPDARRESHSVRRQRGMPRQYRGQRYAGVRDAGGKHPGRSRKDHDERHRAVPYGRWREGAVLPLPRRGSHELLYV